MDQNLDRFSHPTYLIRKKFFKIFGEAFHIYGPDEQVVLYSKLKAFKLKEDIRLYADESMDQELLTISARHIIDWGATYDVHDPVSGHHLGSLRRKALKSFLRDEWVVFDDKDNQIAVIQEDSMLKALVRRFVELAAIFMPQKYHVEMDGQTVCTFAQKFNPFIQKIEIDFRPDPGMKLDRRLGLAAGVLLSAIEGRQGEY